MADPSTITSIIADPLVQYGALGIFALYCLYTDWSTRRENRRMEDSRIAREVKREEDAHKREEECIARIRALEQRHTQQILGVLVRNNTLFEAVLRKDGIDIPRTPVEGL